ncbi:outer-membrane receptor for ferric coprogen and ferric-rhodotorulic acid [Kushneria avicenniae]|uniref:Outer-membrane receptor for ferric coprogen and ferric-rhodotorulic acid n=1 Tax=Kushneria avicenniae TaxID=402385 RepID=A0A1I1LML5_9GAMM|nr:TonB-dependent siderophore receptor [Kushneria avicenniae]SFC74186.1 outer-membrane receptor for ferric coprogen and ferric-rhodotorulic acid [Kushneria avicenniae]
MSHLPRQALALLVCAYPLEIFADETLNDIVVIGERTSTTSEATKRYTVPVTRSATGLALTPRETPQSTSVVTRQQIDDQALQTTGDVLSHSAGISENRADSNRTSYSARGFDIRSFQFDGLNIPINRFWNFGDTDWDTVIYDRVEVVRGATGLLTGEGEPSASVNFVRKRPLPEPAVSFSTAAGRWDRQRISADVSMPLTSDGTTGVRFVAAKDRKDSFMAHMEDDHETLYGVISSELTPGTQLTAGVEYQHNETLGAGASPPLFYADGGRTDFDRSAANNTPWSTFYNETTRVFVDASHTLDNGWTLRAAMSHNDGNYGLEYLYRGGYPDRETGLGMSNSFLNYRGNRTQQTFNFTAEGHFDLLGRQHELGLGWVRSEDDFEIKRAAPIGDTPEVDSYFNWHGSVATRPQWGDYSSSDDTNVTQNGGYLVSRFSLSDPLSLIIGARLSDWELDQTYYGDERQYRYSNELTPYAGLVYDVNRWASLYASYTEIFQSQNARFEDGSLLDPIQGRSYEVGAKTSFFGGLLDGSVALFRTEQDNVAEAIPGVEVIGQPGTAAYRSVDGNRVNGVELELVGELMPDWNLSASYTLANAENADGERTNTTHPRRQLKLFTTYQLPGEWQGLTIGGGARWQSDTWRDARSPNGRVQVGQGGYTVADMMARYRFNEVLSAQLNVNNVFDKRYYEQIGFYSQYWLGEPRNAVLSLNLDW